MYNRKAGLLSGSSDTEVLTGDALCTQNHFLEFLKENCHKSITASNTCLDIFLHKHVWPLFSDMIALVFTALNFIRA